MASSSTRDEIRFTSSRHNGNSASIRFIRASNRLRSSSGSNGVFSRGRTLMGASTTVGPGSTGGRAGEDDSGASLRPPRGLANCRGGCPVAARHAWRIGCHGTSWYRLQSWQKTGENLTSIRPFGRRYLTIPGFGPWHSAKDREAITSTNAAASSRYTVSPRSGYRARKNGTRRNPRYPVGEKTLSPGRTEGEDPTMCTRVPIRRSIP